MPLEERDYMKEPKKESKKTSCWSCDSKIPLVTKKDKTGMEYKQCTLCNATICFNDIYKGIRLWENCY
jgi:hypothetical protein